MKKEIIETVSMFFDQTDMESTGNMNEPEDKYMVNEFGRVNNVNTGQKAKYGLWGQ